VSEAIAADRRLHPATLIGRTLRIIPEAAGGMVAYGAVIARADLRQFLMLAGLGLVIAAVSAFLSWWRFRYGVGPGEIVIQSGVLKRQRRVIPFERVQDIAIERPLLARLFGTARVRIETGGSAADEGRLDSISLAHANELRDIVRGRAGVARAEAGPTEAAEPLLFAMSLRRVAFSGLFNFSLVFIAFLGVALSNANELGLLKRRDVRLPFEAGPEEAWLAAMLVAMVALLLLGVVAGVLRTLARDYGFRLTRTDTGLRRRRGLFTLSETVIPVRRIQLAAIESGIVARALGWRRLEFQTLGGDGKGSAAQVAAPFARTGEILPILAEAGYPDPGAVGDWTRSPRRSIVNRAALPLAAGAAALAVAWLVEPMAGAAAAILLALAAASPLRWSRCAFALSDTSLSVATGVLKNRMRIMPFARAQTISVVSTPFQRMLRLASVVVDTAGAPAFRSFAVADLDSADAEALAERLLALLKEARRARSR
jgi:putative membrane protein